MTTTQTTDNKSPYWGFFGTLGLGVIAFIIYGLVQAAIIIGSAFSNGTLSLELLTSGQPELEKTLNDIIFNGDLLGLSGIPSTLVGVGIILLFIILRETLSVKQYLDLRLPQQPIKTFLKWIGAMVVVFALIEFGTRFFGHEPPEFMSRLYNSTNNKVMLWITVAVAAPIFEEFLFRGFLLEGLRHSLGKGFKKLHHIFLNLSSKNRRNHVKNEESFPYDTLGVIVAVLFTSGIFAIIHQQYGWFEIASIFVIGVIFAVAKLQSKSLYIPIAMHMFMNFSASALMELAPELAQ